MFSKLSKLFKSSSIYTIGSLINRSLFLISMPIMTRYLVPEEYGILALINAVIAILMTLYGLGTTSSTMRFYYECESDIEQKRLLGAILSYILLFTFFISIFLSMFGDSFSQKVFRDISFSPYMLLGIWICFISMFGILPDALFRILNQPVLFVSVAFSKSVLNITLSIISVVVLKRGAEGPLGASLVAGIIAGIYYLFYLRDKISLNFSVSVIKKCLEFGIPVLFLLLGRVLLNATDRLILQRFVDLSIVGLYSVGATVGSILVMVASSIDSAWTPFFYATAKNEDESEAKGLFSYASTYVGAIILFLGLCAAIFRHEIIYILAPPSYYPVIEIIPIIMIGATFNALFLIPVRGIYQQKKTVYLPFIILVALIINITLNFILIPRYQMFGAALATAAASFVMLVSCFVISQKIYCIPYQYKRLFKILVSCILCYVLSEFVQGYPLLRSIIIRSFIVMLFPLFIYSFRFFEPREIAKIKYLTSKCMRRVKPA